METKKAAVFLSLFCLLGCACDGAKINTPRVLLPWFEDLYVSFTFEIIEGGCYTWSLSRDDIIDLEPLYDDAIGHCSRAARVSVSKSCVPPGSVIILAEEVNSGEILRGDVDIDKIRSLKVMSTTWNLFLEEAPEAFEVVAYDDQGNTFSTLEGITFTWSIENLGSNVGEEPLVTLVRWRDTDYEAPRGVTELEARGLRSHSVLLYGQAMGESRVTVCLEDICTDFDLQVIASVVLMPAVASIVPGDTLRYRVVRARAGRLTVQDISETMYFLKVPDASIASLEDSISLVKGTNLGSTSVYLMSGATEVATATLTVAEPHSIRVTLRPSSLLIRGEPFIVHCVVLDNKGHPLTAGDQILIRLSVEGEANVDLLQSTENGTLTDAVAQNAGPLTITARLYSVAGRSVSRKVEGEVSAIAVEPLEIVPPHLYVAWTDNIQEINLKHIGGGDEPVTWSEIESDAVAGPLSLTSDGAVTIRGTGEIGVRVQLKKYPHVKAIGRVWSAPFEMLQVSTSSYARVGKPHHLHIALTATNAETGELYNFHTCNCGSFAVTLLEGPEPQNVTVAKWVKPVEGACCVLECAWNSRGVSTVRVSRGRVGDTTRVAVRAAPSLLWPLHAAALPGATLPILAEGEALSPQSLDTRIAEISPREGRRPHRYPAVQLFTLKCRRKGESRIELTSEVGEERESVSLDARCAPHVSRVRLEPPDTPGNCSTPPKIWLRPGQELAVKVTLLDSIGRELLDENGPKMSWEVEPHHPGLQYKADDRLFVETHPEYAPVPVPFKYFQVVVADDNAIGWHGALKASIPDASASIQARVVAPLKCDPLKVNIAWESETVSNIATITGGSGRYAVETPKGVSAEVEGGSLSATVPGPGSYDLVVTDLCVQGEKQLIEVHIEEVLSVEVSTSRAVGVGACVPISALVKGVSHRYLGTGRAAEWRAAGPVAVRDNTMCGLTEGTARVRALYGGVWSPELEVLVFPPLSALPRVGRVPPGARLQLRHAGGPPPHLAALHYRAVSGLSHVEVTSSGSVHGLSLGTSRIKLVATDISNVEMASAECEVEVIPISGVRVKAATQSLLVGSPGPIWVEAGGLSAGALAALQPAPRVSWSLRDPTAARLYTTHADDMLERSVAEGLSVRVVPLKPGVITIDVRVRNMGQVAETRSWDSTIEILGLSDIRTSVEGLSKELSSGDRLALAVSSVIRLKSLPRGNWKAYGDGALTVNQAGEVTAVRPGFGVILAQHRDDRNNIYRETAIHVEVAVPTYCTAEPSGEPHETGVRLVMRNSVGRALLAPHANVSALAPVAAYSRPAQLTDSVLGTELLIPNLDSAGAFMTFQGSVSGVTLKDEVWVTGTDLRADRVVVTAGWAVCLPGVGWRGPAGITLWAGSDVTLAVLARDTPTTHVLRLDRPLNVYTLHQVQLDKMDFIPGEWPSALVPLSFTSPGLTSGPLLCTEEQRYALEGATIELPYTCRTKIPHTAVPVLDVINGQMGCKIIPAVPITDASEVELCAEWGAYRACTKVLLLPQIRLSTHKVSLLSPPATFTVSGHPQALKLVRFIPSPGLKLDTNNDSDEIIVTVTNEASTCGHGWISVKSKLTAQEFRVDVQRECDVACGTLLGALFSLLKPYLSTVVTVVAAIAAYIYITQRLQRKSRIRMPVDPNETVLPTEPSPRINRSRTWSRSPFASSGPTAPVYGDASMLPEQSFSPNTTRNSSLFL
ncbi:nuclear pore membrane glycoprotein 210 [Helicoverpa zea]|uniref:nuclear pore membrane glycoprotein 210 n=1 Tax=Helicoverpa zea TaxID=7113 RepID=UPI001F5934C1|nr:nuclear pore membrane glycoprotein 210 [Helicoverpa zea]